MTAQEVIVESNKVRIEDFFAAVRRIPAGCFKVEPKNGGFAVNALSFGALGTILQTIDLLQPVGTIDERRERLKGAYDKISNDWGIDEFEQEMRRQLEVLNRLVLNTPTDSLQDQIPNLYCPEVSESLHELLLWVTLVFASNTSRVNDARFDSR